MSAAAPAYMLTTSEQKALDSARQAAMEKGFTKRKGGVPYATHLPLWGFGCNR